MYIYVLSLTRFSPNLPNQYTILTKPIRKKSVPLICNDWISSHSVTKSQLLVFLGGDFNPVKKKYLPPSSGLIDKNIWNHHPVVFICTNILKNKRSISKPKLLQVFYLFFWGGISGIQNPPPLCSPKRCPSPKWRCDIFPPCEVYPSTDGQQLAAKAAKASLRQWFEPPDWDQRNIFSIKSIKPEEAELVKVGSKKRLTNRDSLHEVWCEMEWINHPKPRKWFFCWKNTAERDASKVLVGWNGSNKL